MPKAVRLDPLDVAVRLTDQRILEVQVLHAAGTCHPVSRFRLPWASAACATLVERLASQIGRDLSSAAAPFQDGARISVDPHELGGKLFSALFNGEVGRFLDMELARTVGTQPPSAGGLRLRLFFDLRLADIAALPWELLYHPSRREFLSRTLTTTLSRCLPAERSAGALQVRLPLKVVVVGPAPKHLAPLSLLKERDALCAGLKDYPAVEIREVQPPTLERLVEVLDGDPEIHILHFMGHGSFDAASGEGVLMFEGPRGEAHPVPGEALAAQLMACSALRLVVLNCCKSGRGPRVRGHDPYTSVATALLLAGLPAVVAMQFAVSDSAALAFSGKLYSSLAAGDPVDVAATRGRLAIYRLAPHSLGWITPVLFLQVADGRIVVPEEPPLRVFVVHFLLLGDAEAEAEALEGGIRDLQHKLEPLRISLFSRRMSPDLAGKAPDLLIALFPGRAPVPAAALEGAAEALERSRRSGLLFHAHFPGAADPVAGTPLAELLRRRPELSCSYNGSDDLVARFRQHLLLRLLDEPSEPAVPLAVSEPPWVADLAARLDAAPRSPSYLDRSARRVRDRLQRLGRLFDSGAALSAGEADVLRAAAHLRPLAGAGSPAALAMELGAGLGWSTDFAGAAGRAAAAVEKGVDLTDPSLRTGPWRLDLVAALLRLSEILDLDRQAVSPPLAGSMPEAEADVTDWLAYFTREVRTERGGIVQYVLDAPGAEWIDPLKRATSLRLEVAWQTMRTVFLKGRLAVAVAPSEVIVGAVGKPPAAVLDRLRDYGKAVGAARVSLDHLGHFDHLGEFPSGLLRLILPLPGSAVEGEETLAFDDEEPAVLVVRDEQSGRVILHRPISWEESEIVLDLADLRSDSWYCWWIYAQGADGRDEVRSLGRLRPLSPQQRELAQVVAPGEPGARRALLALGLRSRLLSELIPALESGQATPEDAELAYQLLSDAYHWVSREAPTCPLLEAYRKATLWIDPFQGGPE